jgi:hypothetical protein
MIVLFQESLFLSLDTWDVEIKPKKDNWAETYEEVGN